MDVKFEGEIDRTDWLARRDDDHVHLTLDEYDAADIWLEEGRWFPMLTDVDSDEEPPDFEIPEEAVEWAKAEWRKLWEQCSMCGGPITEEDRRYIGLYVAVAVDCETCRRGSALRAAGLID
jgi:hypothetical protein